MGARSHIVDAGQQTGTAILIDPTAHLSERQKACLRLVARGMSSKEIAIETGLTPQTVDTYIKAAISRLGVSNRREAARLVGVREASQQLGPPSPAVAEEPDEPQAVATATGGWRASMALPPVGGRLNDLTPAARTFVVLRIAAVSSVVVIAIVLFIAAALRTFR